MIKTRLIPCLLLKNGLLVRSEKFGHHQVIGNPVAEVERFNGWNVDELIYLDISDGNGYDLRRDDMKQKNAGDFLSILRDVSAKCFMPLTVGGGIRTLEDIHERIRNGADKVVINTKALDDPQFITKASEIWGRQAIVVAIDHKDGHVWKDHGREDTGRAPEWWAQMAALMGAGEIFLTSIDREGTAEGYDLDTIKRVSDAVTVPVIANGGAGEYEHFASAIKAGASAVAAANIFHFKELSDRNAKRAMRKADIQVRA